MAGTSRSLLEAQRAQNDGRGYLASMIVDLEAQVEGERFSRAKAFKDNGLLANEARVRDITYTSSPRIVRYRHSCAPFTFLHCFCR